MSCMNFDDDINYMNIWQLKMEVMVLRQAIRYHRDQRGDDRCWLDDEKLYEQLPERVATDATLPSEEDFITSCRKFHRCRQAVHFKDIDELYEANKKE